MADFTLNEGLNPRGQAQLIIKGFGLGLVKPKLFNTSGNTNILTLQELAREEGRDGVANSAFGLPVFDIVTLMDLKYESLDRKQISVSAMNLGVALCDVSQSKNIITTPIQGRNGTIKEYISDGDYVINIKGVITIDAQDYYPEQEVKQLKQFLDAPVSLKVASSYLNRLGINEVVVKDYTLNQSEGMRNVQYFELSCLSETPFEIKAQTQNEVAGRTTASPRFI